MTKVIGAFIKNYKASSAVFLVVLSIIGFFVLGSIYAKVSRAAGEGAIWTTYVDCGVEKQDVNHFFWGDIVHINGANFDPGTYQWNITGQPGGASCDPNVVVASGSISVPQSGTFCIAAYTVKNDDCGEYKFEVGNKHDNYRVEESVRPTPTPTPSGSGSPSPSSSASPTPTPSGSPTPTATPTATPTGTPTTTPNPTPTPTETPGSGGGGGTGGTNDGGGSSSSTSTTPQVLAASTMAKTGGFEENLMTAALALGFTLSGISVRGYFASKKN